MKVEEAKTKECPYCILFTEQGLNGKGLIVNDYIYSRCKANACMAWRWHHEDTFIGETVGGKKLFTNGERMMSKTDGYCGLAGKEGAE